MICSKCGQTVADGSKFCLHCGNPLTAAVPAPAQQVPVQPTPQVQPPVQPMPQVQQPVQQYAQPMQYQQPVQQYAQQQYAQPVQYQQPVNYGMPAYAGYPQQWAPPSKFNIKHPGSILTLLGSLFLLLSCFLPCVKLEALGRSETQSLIGGGDGWFHLICIILILVFLFTNLKIGVFATTMVEGIFWLIDTLDVHNTVEEGFGLVKEDVGFWLLLFGYLILLAGAIWLFVNRLKQKR